MNWEIANFLLNLAMLVLVVVGVAITFVVLRKLRAQAEAWEELLVSIESYTREVRQRLVLPELLEEEMVRELDDAEARRASRASGS
ncbi:MAG TPA: hypothetical protein VG079_06685 [Gaiellaceae bacterium]|nr:hypothetical protein [Gaiellaceae bacterium]